MPGGGNIDSGGFYNLVAKIDQNIDGKHRICFRHANNYRHESVTENGIKKAPATPRWAVIRDCRSTLRYLAPDRKKLVRAVERILDRIQEGAPLPGP
jgi:hypothetical protein